MPLIDYKTKLADVNTSSTNTPTFSNVPKSTGQYQRWIWNNINILQNNHAFNYNLSNLQMCYI